VASSRTIIVAGAGIGGLTAALALAEKGYRVVVCEQSNSLQEAGAGIQLSPNATRVLFALGLKERMAPNAVAPLAISIRSARSGREIGGVTLGPQIEFRYGTPYWAMHRADLQAALLAAALEHSDLVFKLGARLEDFVVHAHGATVELRRGVNAEQERGIALIGADGLWSRTRARLGDKQTPQFSGRSAFRALVPAASVSEQWRAPIVRLWLARDAHLVHYPVSGGSRINIVAIVADRHPEREWSAPGSREQLLRRFAGRAWARPARAILEAPDAWQKWSLFEMPPRPQWGQGAMTLLGDAAHPMLPFLAQGAAMAIEDAAMLAHCLSAPDVAVEPALRRYEGVRRARTAEVQRAARQAGKIYHLGGPLAFLRNRSMQMMGREKLRERYDWLYDWRIA
jgi:salicylate hydroxylase